MRKKPDHAWTAVPKGAYSTHRKTPIDVLAPTWFLARQEAAVILAMDPDEITVKAAS